MTHSYYVIGRADDLFASLSDYYTAPDAPAHLRYTNMDDAVGQLTQQEYINMARALRDKNTGQAGAILRDALMRVCLKQAEDEADEERGEELL